MVQPQDVMISQHLFGPPLLLIGHQLAGVPVQKQVLIRVIGHDEPLDVMEVSCR